jgi:Flp pilus assembly protein TadD
MRALFGSIALGLCGLACANKLPESAPPATQNRESPAPPGLYSEMSTPTPLGTAPSCAPGAPCKPAPAASSTGAAAKAPAPPPPEPPKPGTVRGGLARGTGDAADTELFEADKAYVADNYKSAKTHYDKAKKLAPKDPAPRVGLLRVALAESGVPTDYAAGPKNPKILALIKEAEKVVALDQDYGPAHVERGRIELILGHAEKALSSLETGLKLVPNDPEAHSALGVALLATGKADGALERFRRAAELDPDNPARLTNLGTAYMMRGQVDDAVKSYERAVSLAPDDARARGDLGTAYLASNHADKALPHLKRAVELAPDRATFLSNLGYAQQQTGNLDLAIQTYKKALGKDDKLGSAWINLGTALAQKGEYDEAEKAFNKALAIDATDPRAKANLDELAEVRKKKKP